MNSSRRRFTCSTGRRPRLEKKERRCRAHGHLSESLLIYENVAKSREYMAACIDKKYRDRSGNEPGLVLDFKETEEWYKSLITSLDVKERESKENGAQPEEYLKAIIQDDSIQDDSSLSSEESEQLEDLMEALEDDVVLPPDAPSMLKDSRKEDCHPLMDFFYAKPPGNSSLERQVINQFEELKINPEESKKLEIESMIPEDASSLDPQSPLNET